MLFIPQPKNFSHANPAMSFITTPIVDSKQEVDTHNSSTSNEKSAVILQEKTTFDVPMKRNPEFIEVKSKRMQLLMQPSLHAAIKQLADKEGVSGVSTEFGPYRAVSTFV